MIIRSLHAALVFIFLAILPSFAEETHDIRLLYFFSSKCPHCREVMPLLIQLSNAYPVQGYYPRTENRPDVPFPVEPGRRDLQKKYDVPGVPSLVVLVNGAVKQKIAGSVNIGHAPKLLQGFRLGALTVSEAVKSSQGNPIMMTGILTMQGAVFGREKAVYYLTDKTTTLQVNPWLPAEAVKSRFAKKRPRLMSDVVDKVVLLRGSVEHSADGKTRFIVSEEVLGNADFR